MIGPSARRGRALFASVWIGVAGLVLQPAAAGDVQVLGVARFVTNDWLGDRDDRWQTGGASVSWMIGTAGLAELPDRFGALIELRTVGQAITPDNYGSPAGWDRRAAGVLTTTLHSHFQSGGFEYALGTGVAFVGPQTGMLTLQSLIHDLSPASDPDLPPAVLAAQIPNGRFLTTQGEAARRFRLGEGVFLRPFVEVQGGIETFARVGADLVFGTGFDAGVLARDAITGFPYQTLAGAAPPGLTFVLGADTARVFESALLPSADGYVLTPLRNRVRAGLRYGGERLSVFYGASWLGPEFAAQPTGQVVGSLQVGFRF